MSLSNVSILHASAAAVLIVAAAWVSPALSQGIAQKEKEDLSGFKARPDEVALLPRYCWGTFNEKFRGPGMEAFNTPAGCGGGFNHFCPGVLSLARSKSSVGNAQRRSYWLGVADDHMRYTVNALKGVPACPLRGTVDAMVQEIRVLKGSQR